MTDPMTAATPVAMSDADAVDALANLLAEEDQQQPEAAEPQDLPETADEADEPVTEDEPEEPESEDDENEPDEPEDDDGEELIDTVEALAEALDATPEEVMETLKVKVKVNGEVQEVPLAQAVKGYQLEADYTRKTQELAEGRKAFEAERTERIQAIEQQHHALAAILNADEQALQQEYDQVNWNELRYADPAEFAARHQEFQSRYQAIQQKKEWGKSQWDQLQEAQQAERDKQLADLTTKGLEALADEIPEWANEETRAKEQAAIGNFLLALGYSKDELGTLTDPRAIKVARQAWQYQQLNEAKGVAKSKEKPKKVKRVLKPGRKKTQAEVKSGQNKELVKRAKKTQSDDDWTAALMAKLNL